MRPVSAVLALFTISSSLLGQSSSRVARHYPPAGARIAGVHAEYDALRGKTVLQLDPMPLDASLRLSALVALDGQIVRKEAPGVVLTLWSTAELTRFHERRAVTLALDGARPVSLGSAELVSKPRPGFTEILLTSVSLDQWLALASAHKAKFTVGDFSYELKPQLLAAIRDFASRMAPSGK